MGVYLVAHTPKVKLVQLDCGAAQVRADFLADLLAVCAGAASVTLFGVGADGEGSSLVLAANAPVQILDCELCQKLVKNKKYDTINISILIVKWFC